MVPVRSSTGAFCAVRCGRVWSAGVRATLRRRPGMSDAEFEEDAAAQGYSMVDAPVSGGIAAAAGGRRIVEDELVAEPGAYVAAVDVLSDDGKQKLGLG